MTEALVQEECLKLHDIDLMFNEAVLLQGKEKAVGNSEVEQRRETDLVMWLGESWNRVISYDGLQQYPRNCDDDVFFEKLIDITSKAAFKMQKLSSEAENFVRKNLLKKLWELKHNNVNGPERQNEIQEVEKKLNDMDEKINDDKVENYLEFSILDGEKITPHFLRIAETLNSDSLEKIRRLDGAHFDSNKEREAHIVNFYRDLYSLPADMPADFTNCIEEFLGPDICQNPLVVNSKLDENERELLERPLSIAELDESVNSLNLRSAPGIDGVSNKFIFKFWRYLREPLHRYAVKCIEKGSLTDTFRTAIIRLIPKKGDTHN